MIEVIQKWALKVLIAVALLAGVGLYSYNAGIEHQKGVDATKVIKVDNQVVQKNNNLQDSADKAASAVVVYRDRIVTKYQTINKDVVHYVDKNQNASDVLDPEFVSLHDRAASANDQDTIAQPASGVDGGASSPAVTRGQAIAVITANYQRYYQCRNQVIGWNSFYGDIQKQVNGAE